MPLLTKKLVEGLKPKEKPYVEWDSALKGCNDPLKMDHFFERI